MLPVTITLPTTTAELPQTPPETQKVYVWGESLENDRRIINGYISSYAEDFGVSEELMHHIVKRESSYEYNAVGDKKYICKRTGKIAPSYGLSQINICFWPEEAVKAQEDPEFAIRFLAERLSEGKCYLWSTCPDN